MSKRIYIEKTCLELPRSRNYLAKYPNAEVIVCDHYQEVFNAKGQQNFRVQKQNPAMIIAQKQGRRVHPALNHLVLVFRILLFFPFVVPL